MKTLIILRTAFGAIEFTLDYPLDKCGPLPIIIGGDSFVAAFVAVDITKKLFVYSITTQRTQLEHNRLQTLQQQWTLQPLPSSQQPV